MVGKVIPATVAEKAYQGIIRKYLGCLCCTLEMKLDRHAQIHHVTEGYRLGQSEVIGLCSWHHLGQTTGDLDYGEAAFRFGPTMFDNKARFTETYGTERQLLKIQQYFVSLYERHHWEAHSVPAWAVREVLTYWQILRASPPAAICG